MRFQRQKQCKSLFTEPLCSHSLVSYRFVSNILYTLAVAQCWFLQLHFNSMTQFPSTSPHHDAPCRLTAQSSYFCSKMASFFYVPHPLLAFIWPGSWARAAHPYSDTEICTCSLGSQRSHTAQWVRRTDHDPILLPFDPW